MFLKKSPVAQDVASFHLFVGPILISEGPETQSGAVPELIKEAWCRVPVKMWLCDMIWFGGAVFYQPEAFPWQEGKVIDILELVSWRQDSRFHLQKSDAWCWLLRLLAHFSFLFVCNIIRSNKKATMKFRICAFQLSFWFLRMVLLSGEWKTMAPRISEANLRRNIFPLASSSWILELHISAVSCACYMFCSREVSSWLGLAEKGIQGDSMYRSINSVREIQSGNAWKDMKKSISFHGRIGSTQLHLLEVARILKEKMTKAKEVDLCCAVWSMAEIWSLSTARKGKER